MVSHSLNVSQLSLVVRLCAHHIQFLEPAVINVSSTLEISIVSHVYCA